MKLWNVLEVLVGASARVPAKAANAPKQEVELSIGCLVCVTAEFVAIRCLVSSEVYPGSTSHSAAWGPVTTPSAPASESAAGICPKAWASKGGDVCMSSPALGPERPINRRISRSGSKAQYKCDARNDGVHKILMFM